MYVGLIAAQVHTSHLRRAGLPWFALGSLDPSGSAVTADLLTVWDFIRRGQHSL